METMLALEKAKEARAAGKPMMTFDWHKAARLIREKRPEIAAAGLEGDWEYTGDIIYRNGSAEKSELTYLSSCWAMPQLYMDGIYIPCCVEEDGSGWGSKTSWPQSALDILEGDDD